MLNPMDDLAETSQFPDVLRPELNGIVFRQLAAVSGLGSEAYAEAWLPKSD